MASYPGYSISTNTISDLGNRVKSPGWGFFLFQTLTSWFLNVPIFVIAFKQLLATIQWELGKSPEENAKLAPRRMALIYFLVILTILGGITQVLAWFGYAGVGIFDNEPTNLFAHGVATAFAFGGIAIGVIFWFLPILLGKRFPRYGLVVTFIILGMAIFALNLIDMTVPEAEWHLLPWYRSPSFWEWMALLGSILWVYAIWFSVLKFEANTNTNTLHKDIEEYPIKV